MGSMVMFVSWGCRNKVPETGGLNKFILSLFWGQKSDIRVSSQSVLSEGESFPCLSSSSWYCRPSLAFLGL